RNSTPVRHRFATAANYRLAAASVRRTNILREQLGLAFDASMLGTLKIFENRASMASSLTIADMLTPLGMRHDVLDRDATIAVERHLAEIKNRIHGAIYYPGDGAGDACLYTRALAAKAQERGGKVKTNATIRSILTDSGRVTGVETDAGVETAPLVVIAAGNA